MSKTSLKKPKETRATLKPLPPQKRQKAEALSGMSMHDVGVHYNSNLPNQVGCHALTYGNQICLAPSMEKHMDHELGHVIQQKQGRVKPQVGNWNFSRSLEKGADQLGSRLSSSAHSPMRLNKGSNFKGVLQGLKWDAVDKADEFIMDKHHGLIEDYGKGFNKVMSFRRAGVDTIKRMRAGSGKKGHEVLEKSIKDSTINRLDYLKNGDNPTKEQVKKLSGLVGHWSANNTKLEGVYLSKAGKEYSNKLKIPNESVNLYIDEDKQTQIKQTEKYKFDEMMFSVGDGNVLNLHKNMYDLLEITGEKGDLSGNGTKYSKYFLTGDYDLHDLGTMEKNEYKPTVDGTDGKVLSKIADVLNDDKDIDYYGTNDTSYIRHGPQFNFAAHMLNSESEKGKKAPYAVLNADPDLLFYNSDPKKNGMDDSTKESKYKGWYHTESMQDLKTYYQEALGMSADEIPKRFGTNKAAKEEQARERYEIYKNGIENGEGEAMENYAKLVVKRIGRAVEAKKELSERADKIQTILNAYSLNGLTGAKEDYKKLNAVSVEALVKLKMVSIRQNSQKRDWSSLGSEDNVNELKKGD